MKRAIHSIPDDGWTKIKYTDAIYDQDTDTWTSDAEVAEVPFTAFSSKPIKAGSKDVSWSGGSRN